MEDPIVVTLIVGCAALGILIMVGVAFFWPGPEPDPAPTQWTDEITETNVQTELFTRIQRERSRRPSSGGIAALEP